MLPINTKILKSPVIILGIFLAALSFSSPLLFPGDWNIGAIATLLITPALGCIAVYQYAAGLDIGVGLIEIRKNASRYPRIAGLLVGYLLIVFPIYSQWLA